MLAVRGEPPPPPPPPRYYQPALRSLLLARPRLPALAVQPVRRMLDGEQLRQQPDEPGMGRRRAASPFARDQLHATHAVRPGLRRQRVAHALRPARLHHRGRHERRVRPEQGRPPAQRLVVPQALRPRRELGGRRLARLADLRRGLQGGGRLHQRRFCHAPRGGVHYMARLPPQRVRAARLGRRGERPRRLRRRDAVGALVLRCARG